MTEEEIIRRLKHDLTEKRFQHSLAVADMAVQLAEQHGGDVEKARLAGLVHDCMRDTSHIESLRLLSEKRIALSALEMKAFNLWHAILGAAVLEERFGVTDPDIVNAVRYHTTARAGMSLLEKIIYVADCTSADRHYSDVEEVRVASMACLDDGVRASLLFCLQERKRKNEPVHPDTLAAIAQYCGIDACNDAENGL